MKIKGKFTILKGCAKVKGRIVPRGSVAFYWKLGDKGLKVFYGLEKGVRTSRAKVSEIYKHMRKLYKLGVAVKPYKQIEVELDICIKGKRIRKTVSAIKVKHLKNKKDKKGLDKFIKKLKKIVKKTGISNCKDSFKPVNILWDKKAKDWRLVDIR